METVLGDLQRRLQSSGVQNALVDLRMVIHFETKNETI